MKPENKLPVLDLISAEMKTVVNTLQPDLPPWPATGTIAEQRQYYTLERRFWNAGAPEMATRAYMVPTKYGQVETRLFCPQPDSPALGAGGTRPHTDLVQAAKAPFTHGFVRRHTAHRHAG